MAPISPSADGRVVVCLLERNSLAVNQSLFWYYHFLMSIQDRFSDEHSLLSVGEALLSAAIWASSFVAVKMVLAYTGPLTAGGLRYFIAFLLSIPFLAMKRGPGARVLLPPLTRNEWFQLAVMGIFQYTIANAALFFALMTVSATSGSLALSLVPIPVVIISATFLRERPRGLQILGVITAVGGSLLFFSPGIDAQQPIALGALGVSVVSFSVFPILARRFARDRSLDSITLTSVPLGIGGGILLAIALIVEGIPHMPMQAWSMIMGLAIVNTLIAYLLYNHSMRQLTAVQVNVLLNLSPIGTALIAWGALGERLSPLQMIAMFFVIVGAVLTQRRMAR